MSVVGLNNINCVPVKQNTVENPPTVAAATPSFKGSEDEVQISSKKSSSNGWLIGGLIATVGAAALLIAKKDIFKGQSAIQKLVKNIEGVDSFTKKDFVEFGKETLEKVKDFEKAFATKLGPKFKKEHNLKDVKNLLLLGYYKNGSSKPVFSKIIDAKKIGENVKEILNDAKLLIFKGDSKKVL